jgi:hypothetical protein
VAALYHAQYLIMAQHGFLLNYMKQIKVFRTVFNKVFIKVFERDLGEFNLETEDGFNLLQENGFLIRT